MKDKLERTTLNQAKKRRSRKENKIFLRILPPAILKNFTKTVEAETGETRREEKRRRTTNRRKFIGKE